MEGDVPCQLPSLPRDRRQNRSKRESSSHKPNPSGGRHESQGVVLGADLFADDWRRGARRSGREGRGGPVAAGPPCSRRRLERPGRGDVSPRHGRGVARSRGRGALRLRRLRRRPLLAGRERPARAGRPGPTCSRALRLAPAERSGSGCAVRAAVPPGRARTAGHGDQPLG